MNPVNINGVTYKSIAEASRELMVNQKTLGQWIKKKKNISKKLKGYTKTTSVEINKTPKKLNSKKIKVTVGEDKFNKPYLRFYFKDVDEFKNLVRLFIKLRETHKEERNVYQTIIEMLYTNLNATGKGRLFTSIWGGYCVWLIPTLLNSLGTVFEEGFFGLSYFKSK